MTSHELKRTLWEAADKLRAQMDAAEYKHLVLGLIFLKYVSDAFAERRRQVAAELADPASELYFSDDANEQEASLEERDYYASANVFWVPPAARWGSLRNQAKQANIGHIIDEDVVDDDEAFAEKMERLTAQLAEVDLINEMNETLESIARAIFKSWFVDFDPVRAKAEGREPEGMDAATATLFPSEFQDSELGPFPDGWASVPVYELARYVNGAAYKAVHFSDSENGLPIVKIAELKAGVTSNTKFTSANLGEKYRIEQGEILFSWLGNPDTSIDTFLWDGGTAWLNQHIFKVRENGTASRAHIYFELRALRPRFAEIARDKQTTGLGHVTIADLKRIMVCLPNLGTKAVFDAIAGPLLEKLAANQVCCKGLIELRDTLLPRLISGKLRVPEAESMLAGVL